MKKRALSLVLALCMLLGLLPAPQGATGKPQTLQVKGSVQGCALLCNSDRTSSPVFEAQGEREGGE